LKVRADEHVSKKIVEAVRLLCLKDGWEFSHVREDNGRRTADETWLPKFAAEGGDAILTGDANIFKRPHQLLAIRETGLISFVLSQPWTQAKKHEQAANIIYWWPRIQTAIEQSNPGDCWPVPFEFDSSEIKKKVINYEKAIKSLKFTKSK
jgi:PIN like domain